ncbi:cupin -type protein [Ophiocordyceps camponoti-floridani]|uniref:Cupin -type protein n=1 Tax=Ophiocordyceps camponoti-floridani TaxID=2030778 RepID=A0A8H4QD50_9HYPO|nr:cupin -type protein [Ophiocordyceps camponoti-floridani]
MASWLNRQRKSELLELAESLGMTDVDGLKKTELEVAIDEFIPRHAVALAGRSDLAGYFASRSRALGSPVKRAVTTTAEESDGGKTSRGSRRRARASVMVAPIEASPAATSSEEESSEKSSVMRTPPPSLSLAPALPATPADVALAVERSTTAMRRRVSMMYRESGLPSASRTARQTLGSVNTVILCVATVELVFIRAEILSDRYAFTVPALPALGTDAYPVSLPDMFLLLTSSFWIPASTWILTVVLLPCLAGYLFNLRATASPPANEAAVIDPLVYSIAKALVAYIVYGHGATLGLLNLGAVERLEGAVCGGYRGVLIGTAVTALFSLYDAVLRR